MDPVQYLKGLAQRWRVVLAVPLVAVAMAWVTTPDPVQPPSAPRATEYTATATLHQAGESQTGIALVKLVMTRGEVLRLAAEALGEDAASAATLAARVTVSDVPEAQLLSITATDPDPDRAVAIVDAFADATLTFLVDLQQRQADTRRAALEAEYEGVEAALRTAARRALADPEDPLARAEKTAWQNTLNAITGQIVALRVDAVRQPPLQVLERGVARPVPNATGPVATRGGLLRRLLLAGGTGLALGCALALVFARFDTRPRTRAEVQDAYGLPVLAEVPALPASRRHAMGIEVIERPEAAVADGYRTLRSALLLLEPAPMGGLRPAPSHGKADGPRQVLLVTSAREGEGKTSTAVNLAAALSEVGKQVLVIDCDLRNPQCHRYLDVPLGSGVTDLVGPGLEHLARQTRVPNVRLVQAGTGDGGHALLAVQMPHNVEQARQMADVVIIDAPPVLAGNEALDVMAAVDAVLVVTRSGRPSADQVHRARDMVARMGTPVYGLALLRRSDGLLPSLPVRRLWRRRPSSRSDGLRRGRHRTAEDTGISVF